MDKHPISVEMLGRFMNHAATVGERATVVRHLLKGCEACRAQLSHLWPSSAQMDRLSEVQDDRYDAAFERALERAWSAFHAGPGAATQQLLAELETNSPKHQELLVRNHPRYWTAELCSLLISRSHAARFTDMGLMLHQAHLAVLVAESLSADLQAPGESADCRARAWAALGNAHRVAGDLNEAERALITAQAHLKNGSRHRPLYAHILSQLASLRLDQRRFEDSQVFIQQAVQMWREIGNHRELSRSLIKQAILTGEAGKPRAAVQILMEASRLVDAVAEPKLALILMHTMIRFYVDGGQSEVALRLFVEARPLYQQESDPLIRIKALWLEGQILSAERHLEPALKQLSAAREGYHSLGNTFEAAVVSLDLAAVFAKLGKFPEMRALARETLREVEARGVRREAIAALILLQQTPTSEAALALIRRAAIALRAPARRHRLNDGRPGIEQLFL